MDQQEQTPERWWQRFREEFARHLNDPCKGLGEARLRTAWSKEIARTQFYGGCLLVQVAAALGLEIRYEYGRDKIDWAMVDRTTGAPIILIESENTIQKAGDEIPKLCRGKSPLKVLIACCVWGDMHQGSQQTERLNEWLGIVQGLPDLRPEAAVLGLIIGEWWHPDKHEGILTFYCHRLALDRLAVGWLKEPELYQMYIAAR